MSQPARLIFEDTTTFDGWVFAKGSETTSEVVFNTAMAGYQEVLTDPSYCNQIVVMTYPLIGNYGINPYDTESRGLFLKGFIVRDYIDTPSHYQSTQTLKDYLEAAGVMGIQGVDTRALTRYIREKGAQKALLTTSTVAVEDLVNQIKAAPSMQGANLADLVSCDAKYPWERSTDPQWKVAVIDVGVKSNILRQLTLAGCDCDVYPASVTAEEILAANVDGVFVSNGPGDPEPVKTVIETLKGLLGKKPIFGICLGHQLLGLALGGKTYKLKFGHHGVNHPVKNLKSGNVEITSQNHGFCVDYDSLNRDDVELTHINLNDQTVEGIRHRKFPAFSVQYHPEAAPGPHDSHYLFGEFTQMMEAGA